MDAAFGLITVLPLPVWLLMLLFPAHPLTRRTITGPWPFVVLGAVHAVVLAFALSTAPAVTRPDLQQAFASGAGFLAVWAHLRALDLFVGVWMFRDARFWRVDARPYVAAAIFLAPPALAAYLWRRRGWARREPTRAPN